MTLQQVLDRYCQQDHNIASLLERARTPLNPNLEKLIADLDSVHRLVYKILHINKKLEKPVKIMRKLVPAEKEVQRHRGTEAQGTEAQGTEAQATEAQREKNFVPLPPPCFEGAFSESQKKRFQELQTKVAQGFDQVARTINSHRIIKSSLGKVRHILIQRKNRQRAEDSSYEKARITVYRFEVAYKGFEAVVGRIKEVLDEILPPLKEYHRLVSQQQSPAAGKQQKGFLQADFHLRLG
jgi:hypothetical protein